MTIGAPYIAAIPPSGNPPTLEEYRRIMATRTRNLTDEPLGNRVRIAGAAPDVDGLAMFGIVIALDPAPTLGGDG